MLILGRGWSTPKKTLKGPQKSILGQKLGFNCQTQPPWIKECRSWASTEDGWVRSKLASINLRFAPSVDSLNQFQLSARIGEKKLQRGIFLNMAKKRFILMPEEYVYSHIKEAV